MNFFWLEDLKLLKEELPLTPPAPNPSTKPQNSDHLGEKLESAPAIYPVSSRFSPNKAQYFGANGPTQATQNMSPSSSSGSDFSYSPSSNFIEVTNPESGTRPNAFFSGSAGVTPNSQTAINSQSNDDLPLEDPFSAFFAEPSVKSTSEQDASSTAPLDTSFLLDNQVLSECIRNLGYAQDGGGAESIGLPRWKDTSGENAVSKSLPSATSASSAPATVCEQCCKQLPIGAPQMSLPSSQSSATSAISPNLHHHHFTAQIGPQMAPNMKMHSPQMSFSAPTLPHYAPQTATMLHTKMQPQIIANPASLSLNRTSSSPPTAIGTSSSAPSIASGAPQVNKVYSFCTFCKNNGESEAIYGTHYLKDINGIVTCPILRAYTCPICGQNGDKAHTVKYCPVAARLAPKDAPVRSEMRVLRTARTSAGRRRFF